MAEMSVPACPIPIHQTKLVIAKAQAIGIPSDRNIDAPNPDAFDH